MGTGLDTAQSETCEVLKGEVKKSTRETSVPEVMTEGQVMIARDAEARVHTPPSIPFRNEADRRVAKTGCCFCACFAPKAT